MPKGKTFLSVIVIQVISLYLASLSHASFSGNQNIEAMKAFMVAEQSIGKRVDDYMLIDQDGKKFYLKELYDKPLIVSFIYTSCPHACSTLVSSLAKASKDAEEELGKRFHMMTIGFDYERDTPERMRDFGKLFTDDFSRWKFVTADRGTIENLLRDIGFYYSKKGDSFHHANMISVMAEGGKLYQHIYKGNIAKSDILSPLKELLIARKENEALANPKSWRERLLYICSEYDRSTQTYRIKYFSIARVLLEAISPVIFILFFWRKEIYSLYNRVSGTIPGKGKKNRLWTISYHR